MQMVSYTIHRRGCALFTLEIFLVKFLANF